MTLDLFGPFARLFTPEPTYLPLLRLESPGARYALDCVEVAVSEADPRPFVAAMLSDPNWRPHLVACVAYFFDDERRLDRGLLWRAMDAGSWVVPQLAVTASLVDDGFFAAARDRVERRCPVGDPADPAGARSAKLLVSLLTVCEFDPESLAADWAASVRHEPDVVPLLPDDASEHAARHVTRWRTHLRQRLEDRLAVLAVNGR